MISCDFIQRRHQRQRLWRKLKIKCQSVVDAQSTILLGNLVKIGVGVAVVHPFVADHFGDQLEIRPFEPEIDISYGLIFAEGSRRLRVADQLAKNMRICFSGSGQFIPSEPDDTGAG